MATNVKYIKLLNGEELIAEVVTEDLKTVIRNPIRLVIMPSRNDPKNPQVGLAPWAEFSDDKEIVLDRSHILAIMTPIQEIVNQYNSIFGGIVAPSSKLILPT
jgi:hypothetical protein